MHDKLSCLVILIAPVVYLGNHIEKFEFKIYKYSYKFADKNIIYWCSIFLLALELYTEAFFSPKSIP